MVEVVGWKFDMDGKCIICVVECLIKLGLIDGLNFVLVGFEIKVFFEIIDVNGKFKS